MFQIRWLLSRAKDRRFHRTLWVTLRNPLTYYFAALQFLVQPQRRPITLYFRDGKEIRLRSFMSLYIFAEIFIDRTYDHEWEPPPRTAIDIGANTGMFVLRAKQLWPHCSLVCYEPELGNFQELQHTIRANRQLDVTVVNAAVTETRGEVVLYHHPRNLGGHSVVHRHSDLGTAVPAETITDALDRQPEPSCDLLKVDCEGAEAQILRSFSADTTRRIKTIVYEPDWRHYSIDELNRHLEQFGFTTAKAGDLVFAFRKDSAPGSE